MEGQTEIRLEKIEKLLNEQINQSEIKHTQIKEQINCLLRYPNYVVTVIGIIIVLLGIVSVYTLESEKKRLRQIETDTSESITTAKHELKADINSAREELKSEFSSAFEKGMKLPNVILLKDIDQPLEGQTVAAKILPSTDKNHKFRVKIPFIFKNDGNGPTDQIIVKTYTTKDFQFGSPSSDERAFSYELFTGPEKMPFPFLPAKASVSLSAETNVKACNEKLDSYPVLMKVYFGGESPSQANFNINLPKQMK